MLDKSKFYYSIRYYSRPIYRGCTRQIWIFRPRKPLEFLLNLHQARHSKITFSATVRTRRIDIPVKLSSGVSVSDCDMTRRGAIDCVIQWIKLRHAMPVCHSLLSPVCCPVFLLPTYNIPAIN